ncbi:DUF305 domain-containing protein [Flavobacterium sp.]|uniref:DUF305 domain-containing protein n=1 Tax=Flavobacterium sp. TaxID=239 RepID=UPI00286DEE5F|nr:DUF305 domain-containing protein [Flavobacterium sp.]
MKILIALILFSLVAPNSCKNSDAEDELQMNHSMPIENELMESMNKTTTIMNNTTMNGDFDFDFANLMIMHHQMANDMSRIEIEKGSDETIKKMANGIIVAQEIEIRQMQQFLQNYKIPVPNNQISNSYKIAAEMKSMIDNMSKIKMFENMDEDYVAMMIPHHQSAVSMAKQQLNFGKQDVLLELSKNIIEDQSFEIEEFKNWQSKN